MEKRRRLSLRTWQRVGAESKLVHSTTDKSFIHCPLPPPPQQQQISPKGKRNCDNEKQFPNSSKELDDSMTPKVERDESHTNVNLISTLSNLGNTCYMNCIIFVMRYLKQFRNCIHNLACRIQEINENSYCEFKRDAHQEVILQLHELLKTMHRTEFVEESVSGVSKERHHRAEFKLKPLCPVKVLESIRDVDIIYEGNQQHDAHEFLGFLLNCIEKTFSAYKHWQATVLACKTTRRSGKVQAVAEKVLRSPLNMFEGKRMLKIQCLECENYSQVIDQFRDVAINYDFANHDHEKFLNALQDRDVLRNEDKFWCNFCLHHNEARCSSSIFELPEVLIIRMRPSAISDTLMKDTGRGEEDKTVLPAELECFLESCSSKPCLQPRHHFELTAVICHIGASLTTGHYVVYVKSTPRQFLSEVDSKRPDKDASASDNCCSPIMTVSATSQWLLFSDDNLQFKDAIEFTEDRSNETPYLLIYQCLKETNVNQET